MRDDQHEGVLLEDINDKLQRLAEGVSTIIESTQEIKKVIADIPEMKGDIKTIKAAVAEQGRELGDHEHRLQTLERAA